MEDRVDYGEGDGEEFGGGEDLGGGEARIIGKGMSLDVGGSGI